MHINSLIITKDDNTELIGYQDDKEKFSYTGISELDYV